MQPRIAAALNADAVPTPHGSTWQVGTVGYILDNVLRYAGWLEHNRYSRAWGDPYLRTRGQWPPLITEADAARIQAERAARAAIAKGHVLEAGALHAQGVINAFEKAAAAMSAARA
jgi:hypothetical protein